ncbi:MAG: cobalamin B12-binding domain-containing protein [Caulobacteraceae bacterium]|nr:cobalamin B12-binding domain-containing protein [Caulobacter sp.]
MNDRSSVPRLAAKAGGPRRHAAVTPRRLDACADAFARGGFDRAQRVLGRMCDAAEPQAACEHVLAPVARGLGDRWVADTCDFATLTLAMGRLHSLLHGVSRRWRPPAGARLPPRRALVAAAPGEQHIFGAAMIAEALRAAGWEVTVPQGASAADLVARVKGARFDLVGLSVACDASVEGVARTIADLRAAARGAPAFLVGGRPFSERPELARATGADGVGRDCATTLALAETLCGRLAVAA